MRSWLIPLVVALLVAGAEIAWFEQRLTDRAAELAREQAETAPGETPQSAAVRATELERRERDLERREEALESDFRQLEASWEALGRERERRLGEETERVRRASEDRPEPPPKRLPGPSGARTSGSGPAAVPRPERATHTDELEVRAGMTPNQVLEISGSPGSTEDRGPAGTEWIFDCPGGGQFSVVFGYRSGTVEATFAYGGCNTRPRRE